MQNKWDKEKKNQDLFITSEVFVGSNSKVLDFSHINLYCFCFVWEGLFVLFCIYMPNIHIYSEILGLEPHLVSRQEVVILYIQ